MAKGWLTFIVDRINFFLGIDADQDYASKPQGTYLGGRNISHYSDESSSYQRIQNVRGNEFVFQPEDIVLQNRIFRINFSSASAGTYGFNFLDANGNVIATMAATAVVAGNIASTMAVMIGVLGLSLNASPQIGVGGYTAVVTITGTDTAYITLEITAVPSWDYDVENFGGTLTSAIILVQEAVDQSLVGTWIHIGSFDLEGELLTWWTTQKNLPIKLDISNVANNGGLFEITTSVPHGLLTNEKIIVNNTPTSDGQWIVTVTGLSTVTLQGSTFAGGWVSGGTLTTGPNGNGEVSREVKNEVTKAWTYVRLIRSQKFNFVTKHQIDAFCKKDGGKKHYKWTDDYNPPAVLYDRTVVYQNDCLLNFVDPLNPYDYFTLSQQIILQLNTGDFDFSFTGQTQLGGNVASGNSRYAAQLGTKENTWTEPSFLDNPIPAAVASEGGSGFVFYGDNPNTPTPKINNFIVTGNILTIFDKIRLITVNYQGTAISGYIVTEQQITSNTIYLQHTGFEQNTQNFDIGLLNQIAKNIRTAKSIDELFGYLIFSNITTTPSIDLSDWAHTFEWQLGYDLLRSVGSIAQPVVAEYMESMNVYRSTGYTFNERERFAVQAEMLDGTLTPCFHIADVIFNCDATQTGCIGALADFNFTTGIFSNAQPRAVYVDFSGWDIDAIVDGVRLRDVIRAIRIMRANNPNPQVLATGYVVAAVNGTVAGGLDSLTWYDPNNPATTGQIGEFPLVAGYNEGGTIPANYAYGQAGAPISDFVVQPNYASFYASDMALGHTAIVPAPGDQILNFGQPPHTPLGVFPTAALNDYHIEFTGQNDRTFVAPPTAITITEGHFVARGSSVTIAATGLLYSKKLVFAHFPTGGNYDAAPSLVLYSASGTFARITAYAGTDRGLRIAQYYRAKTAQVQFGNPENNTYVWTGIKIRIDDTTVSPYPAGTKIFGGDTFEQRSFIKNRYPNQISPEGFGQGIGAYSPNKANFQMRTSTNGTDLAFPTGSATKVQDWLNPITDEVLIYNEGYTIRNGVTSYVAFDPNAEINTDEPVTFAWSQKEVAGSAEDAQRVILPLNRKVLEYRNGEVINHAVRELQLYAWQPLGVFRLPFIPNEIITTKSGVEVLLGDGAVMSREALPVTDYGCSNKWAIVEGMSEKGNKVFYWIDTIKKAFLRWGGDGLTTQSLIHGMDVFFANNLSIVFGKDTPADDQGICSTWNQRFREAIFTSRAWRDDIEAWENPFNIEHHFNFPTGSNPISNLIEVGGLFYGVTTVGGASGLGTLFSFDPATGTYVVLHSFIAGVTGNTPQSGVALASNGKLYGTTSSGGVNGDGVIYEWDIGLALYTKKIDFDAITGSQSAGAMVLLNNRLYGLTQNGGLNGLGVLYEYMYLPNTYTVIHDLDTPTGAEQPGVSYNSLTVVGTELYGMTYVGGTSNSGVIFKTDLITYTKLFDLGGVVGANPTQSLTLLNNKLYGVTLAGGANNFGVIFSYDYVNSAYTVLYNFDGTAGQSPQCTLTAVGNELFGTTSFGGAGNFGTLFSYNTVLNTFNLALSFAGTDGSGSRSSMLLFNNILYGMTRNGGTFAGGVLFSATLDYDIGSAVSIGTFTGYEQIPAYYESLVDNNLSDPATSPTWAIIELTNPIYYNFYTIIFNENKNHFTTDNNSWHPKIYMQYRNGYLSTDPIHENKAYEHNRGNYCEWYDLQQEDGYVILQYGKDEDAPKMFHAIGVAPEETPARIDCYTKNSQGDQHTFMLASDFEDVNGERMCAIKNNTFDTAEYPNPTNSNEADTSKIWGNYIIIKITFPFGVKQQIGSVVLKFTELSRNYKF